MYCLNITGSPIFNHQLYELRVDSIRYGKAQWCFATICFDVRIRTSQYQRLR
jgi:hypothetical protein